MFCPSCGTENADRARTCGECGLSLPGKPLAQVIPPYGLLAEWCGLAFTSTFFGIVAYLICFTAVCFLPAMAAVLIGHMTLISIGQSPRGVSGRIFAIIGLVLGYSLLVILLTARLLVSD